VSVFLNFIFIFYNHNVYKVLFPIMDVGERKKDEVSRFK